MQDQPAPDAMLDIVTEFLREQVLPLTDGHTAFHLRVAINMLALVRREIAISPNVMLTELERLTELTQQEGDIEALTRSLCEAIEFGGMQIDNALLVDHLWRTTLDKMAVDQPRYAAFVVETMTIT